MIIDKNYKNIKRLDNGNYYIEGDLKVDEDLEVNLDDWLEVQGSIQAKGKIASKQMIIAGHGIKAGNGIEAGYGIQAGKSITAKYISSKLRILAGLSILEKEDNQINVEEVKEGEICYGELNIIRNKEGEK